MSDQPDDAAAERLNLLRQLDPVPREMGAQALDPEVRTFGGRRLTTAEAELLRSCKADDLHRLADALNDEATLLSLGAEMDRSEAALLRQLNAHEAAYTELLRRLNADVANYTELLTPYLGGGGGEEGAISRMPAAEQREARRLQQSAKQLEQLLPPDMLP